MKYFLVLLFFFIISCSTDNNRSSKMLSENINLKDISFDKFYLYLLEYSNKSDYPNINE